MPRSWPCCSRGEGFGAGELWGLESPTWLWLSIGGAVAHQVFVALVWRAELHGKRVTGWLGRAAFPLYALVFQTLLLLVSLKRHFGVRRAMGADHFDPAYRSAPLVRRGLFRVTPNAMYVFGFALLWIPGFLLASRAALLSAAFQHAYIWVHYGCTERPDMARIYAPTAASCPGTRGAPGPRARP